MMNINKRVLSIILTIVLLVSLSSSEVKAYSGIEIDHFDIEVKVLQSGVIHVKQKLDVNFKYDSHGIIVDLPSKYEKVFDGKTKYYDFPIKNIQVQDVPYSTSRNGSITSIKIGDPDLYVSDLVTYNYSYEVHTKDLKLDGEQFFYFNLVGDGWEMPINKTSFTIEFEQPISAQPEFYGPYNDDNLIDYNFDGVTLTGTYNEVLLENQALSVYLDLPNDYFVFTSANDSYMLVFIILLSVILIINYLLFNFYGRDDHIVKTVEFSAPNNMSSAQVGYILHGKIRHDEIVSLLIYWASKGYLSIHETDNKNLMLEKIMEIPRFEIEAEQILFNKLFSKSSMVGATDFPQVFLMALPEFEKDIAEYYSKEKILYEKKAYYIKNLISLLFILVVSAMVVTIVYQNFTNDSDLLFITFLATFSFLTLVSIIFNGIFFPSSSNAWKNIKSASKRLGSISTYIFIIPIFVVLLNFATLREVFLVLVESLSHTIIYTFIILLLIIINIIILIFMPKRTSYASKTLGRLLGFKHFIIVAEKDRIDMLVNDNPHYFFDVLPYAYVFDVSKDWVSNFSERIIGQPSWYVSDSPIDSTVMTSRMFTMYNVLNTNFNNQYTAANTPTSTNVGQESSFGGGFSGGGFGGGGGRGW